MPISAALWFCVPIGLLFYFTARWLVRLLLGRFERKDRRAAYLFGAFGALSIPLIYFTGLLGEAISGRLGQAVANGLFALATAVLIFPLLMTLIDGKWRKFGNDHRSTF